MFLPHWDRDVVNCGAIVGILDDETEDQPLSKPSEEMVHENPRENGVLHRNGASPVALFHRVGHAAEAGRLNVCEDSFDLVFGKRLSGRAAGHLASQLVH